MPVMVFGYKAIASLPVLLVSGSLLNVLRFIMNSLGLMARMTVQVTGPMPVTTCPVRI
ncbi:MAG: hypothetical protein ILP18_01210 [Treponema sp.]|nr:hypothetical protein [Treponema sp.]